MAIEAGGTRSEADVWKHNSRIREVRERVIKLLLTACAYLSIFTTVGIVIVLFEETARFCQVYDQSAFDPAYDSAPLSFFEPMVRRVFARPINSMYAKAAEADAA